MKQFQFVYATRDSCSSCILVSDSLGKVIPNELFDKISIPGARVEDIFSVLSNIKEMKYYEKLMLLCGGNNVLDWPPKNPKSLADPHETVSFHINIIWFE